MQAGDLKTLLSLQQTSTSNPETAYQSSHDAHELLVLANGQGLGMDLYDDGSRDADEFFAAAEELGLPVSRD
jgi:hypothetical protein